MINITLIILLILFLAICTFTDIRRKEINLLLCIAFSIIGLVLRIYLGADFFTILYSLAPGLFLLFMSIASPRNLGAGDGFMLITIGCYLNFQPILSALVLGSFILLIFSIPFLIKKRMNFHSELPFAPFLTTAIGIMLLSAFL